MTISLRKRIDIFKDKVEDHVDKFCYLSYGFENEVRELKTKGLSTHKERELRDRGIYFVTISIQQIKNRLPDNFKILKSIGAISVENTLKPQKPDIFPLIELFDKSTIECDKIINQWNKIHLIEWKNTSSTKQFWYEVNHFTNAVGENPFSEVTKFALNLLCLPHSNAEVERLFSNMNVVKNKVRNRLELGMLRSILIIRASLKRYNTCNKFELPENVSVKSNL